MIINITPANVIEQVVMYGVVHGVWELVSFLRRRAKKEIRHIRRAHRQHRNAIIKNHVKAAHEGRLKHCIDEACASLRNQKPGQLVPVEQELHKEL